MSNGILQYPAICFIRGPCVMSLTAAQPAATPIPVQLSERPSRSSFPTTRQSPGWTEASACWRPGPSSRAPLALSAKSWRGSTRPRATHHVASPSLPVGVTRHPHVAHEHVQKTPLDPFSYIPLIRQSFSHRFCRVCQGYQAGPVWCRETPGCRTARYDILAEKVYFTGR